MKLFTHLITIIILFSCNSQKNLNTNLDTKKSSSLCPEDGKCTFEVIKNKSFTLKSKFGDAYPEFYEDENKSLLKFEYNRNLIPDTEDSSYTEIIYIEIDNTNKEIEVSGKALSKAKVTFGRLCFCRGQSGYFTINDGDLSIIKDNSNYKVSLNFKSSKTPQVITTIKETFKL